MQSISGGYPGTGLIRKNSQNIRNFVIVVSLFSLVSGTVIGLDNFSLRLDALHSRKQQVL